MKVKLSQAFDLQMGKTPSRNIAEYWDGNHKWVSIADIGNAGKYISATKECITDDGVSGSGIKIVPKGTVIMSFKLSIGKTTITSEDMYTNEAIMAFIDKGIYPVDPNYLYHLCCGTDWTAGTNKAVMGLTLNKATLSEKMINLPSVEEQKDIAEKLDEVDSLINIQQRQLAKLDELVKSRFVEMFGDPVENTKKWTVHFLCDVCTKLTDGTHFSPESYETGEYRYVTAKNIKISGFDFSNITYVNADVHNEIYARCNPEYGDVLYIKDGVTTGIAMVNTLHEPFTMLSSVALLKQNRAIVDGTYLCGVLNNQHMYDAIRSDMGGAAITRLTITKLNRIEIPVPPLALQQQFTAFVEQIDKSKLAVKQSLEKLETLKKSLMQQYFG